MTKQCVNTLVCNQYFINVVDNFWLSLYLELRMNTSFLKFYCENKIQKQGFSRVRRPLVTEEREDKDSAALQ